MECARQEELGTDRFWLEFSHWRAKIVIVEVGVWDLGLHYYNLYKKKKYYITIFLTFWYIEKYSIS